MSEQAVQGFFYFSTIWLIFMYVALSITAGCILGTKNRDGYAAFILALLLSPLPILLYALGAAPKRRKPKA